MKTNWYDQFEKLHSLIKYLSSTTMSSTVLGAKDTARKQNKKICLYGRKKNCIRCKVGQEKNKALA